MLPHTAQQLRNYYNIKHDIELIYENIISAAKAGRLYYDFNIHKDKSAPIMNELFLLFPDTKIIELSSLHKMYTYRASWALDNNRGAPILK